MFFLSKVTINFVKLFQSFFLDLFSIETINFEFEHSREWFTYPQIPFFLFLSIYIYIYIYIYFGGRVLSNQTLTVPLGFCTPFSF